MPRDECSYLMDDGETRCARPAAFDYYGFDPIVGSTWIASLCRRHHRPASQAYAVAHNIEWREREATVPAVAVVE